MQRRVLIVRALVVAAVVVAVAALASVTLGVGSSGYEVTARFQDAGQLVKGGTVQVAGGNVGTIKEIRLSDDGVAEVVMTLGDEVTPLHQGTRAQIRSLGLSGVANRFVDLSPGPESAPPIDDGGELGLAETNGIVDLDAVLTSLDPTTRKKLQGLLKSGGNLLAGERATDANRTLKYLNPALAEGRALARELTLDRTALTTLLTTGATTARTVAAHDASLRRGLDASATTLRALADERGALDDILLRAPAASRSISGSLDRIGPDLDRIRPALTDLAAAAPGLANVARRLPPAAQQLTPVLATLRQTLPNLNATLRKAPALNAAATPAFASTATAVRQLTPILTGLRPYAPDLIAGVFLGFGGTAGNTFDANGHLARIAFTGLGAGASGIGSLLAPTGALGPLTPQTKVLARCPGNGAQQAPDGSNDAPDDSPNCDPKARR